MKRSYLAEQHEKEEEEMTTSASPTSLFCGFLRSLIKENLFPRDK
jgi:hypothetical protein